MLSNTKGSQLSEYYPDFVVFDLETTGTSCYKDSVIEISAIKVVDHKIRDEFSSLVYPGRSIPNYASQVNGITDELVADAPEFEKVLKDFIEFIGSMTLVGHNINAFDMKFIYRDCQKYYGSVLDNDYIDTLKLARKYLPKLEHHTLSDIAEYYGISTDGAHRVLNDCRMNQKVYEKLGKMMM